MIVRSASGRDVRSGEPVTSANIGAYAPDPGEASAVRGWFAGAGFSSGDVVGVAFSISAPIETFERTFGVAVHPAETGGFVAAAPDGVHGTFELPLGALPGDLARLVVAITFEPPAEAFGQQEVDAW